MRQLTRTMKLPLEAAPDPKQDRHARLAMLAIWAVLVLWLASGHVMWRDEVRAFSLALSGDSFAEMLAAVQGEGHPALWYLILRAVHNIAPYREVLPIVGLVFGFAAMGLFVLRSPFRLVIVGLVLFSYYGAFEYVVVTRNYGIAALVMFAIAANYDQIKNSYWFGVALAILCNTNVASCLLAAAFLLFRFLELVMERKETTKKYWITFVGNAALAAIGAWLCFKTVYPTFNESAVSLNFGDITASKVAAAIIDIYGYKNLGLPHGLILAACCVGLVRNIAALVASLVGFITLKLFFFLVYPSYYRHEALFLVFLLSMYWIVARQTPGRKVEFQSVRMVQVAGQWLFAAVLALQALMLLRPIYHRVAGIPYSWSAEVGKLLTRPELANAIVMADPDTLVEPLAYYADNPLWMLRQQHFGKVVRLKDGPRSNLSLSDVLADAQRLQRATGRPIVYLSVLRERHVRNLPYKLLFTDTTTFRKEELVQFRKSTRLIASYRRAGTDESYDVYVYPR